MVPSRCPSGLQGETVRLEFAGVALKSEVDGGPGFLDAKCGLPDDSSSVCDCRFGVCVCSPSGSYGWFESWGALNLFAAFASAFCFQPYVDAMLAALFFFPGFLFEGVGEDKNKKVKISSSFLPGRDLTQVSCSIRV